MDIRSFVNLTSKAWTLPILASFHTGVAGRQAALLTATGANRNAFAQSLDHLIEMGLIERNPGHGHPLRPEFRLTPSGKATAALAHKIQIASIGSDTTLLRRSWTLPVLAALHTPRHFNDIKRSLETITDRALSQSLKSLEGNAWVRRAVDNAARPPRSLYASTSTGKRISQVTVQEIGLLQ